MKIVVGVQPDEQGDEALARAEALARSMRAHLVLAHVYPTPWRAPEPGAVDSEWRAYLVEQSRSALLRAERRLSGAVGHELVVHPHTSTGRGLAEVAEEHGGSLIVIGAGPGGEPDGCTEARPPTSCCTARRCRCCWSRRPRATVPEPRPLTPSRVTVAYQRSLDSAEALHAAAQLCRRTGAPLRLVTLVLHPPRTLRSYERSLDDLRADARHWLDEALIEAPFSTRLTAEIAEGDDFEEAMAAVDCEPDELLVCGSGTAGPLRRVFLGDTAQKILRAATVPVLVVPRHAETELDRTRAIPKVRD